jgi:hypothetical protein
VWVDEALVDTTWPMALATPSAQIHETHVEVSPLPKSNILWRWMGVRPVSHLPCSFACQATVALADRLIDVGRRNGYDQEMDWLLEILDWPVEWSAWHGVAEIKTPVLKVSTRTDATPCKYTVRYRGRSVPAEAAQGLRFPFVTAAAAPLTTSAAFQRGLEHPIGVQPATPPWFATDNGFATVAAMDRAHQPIVKLAGPALAENPGPVLDLGCGNGALLKRLLETQPAIVPFGVDSDAARIAHAQELLPQFADHLVAGNLFDLESFWPEGRRYALVLLMPGRLLEVAPARAAALRDRLRACCDRVLLYAYGDWLTRHGSLDGLAAQAGFRLVGADNGAPAAFAEATVSGGQ